MTKITKAQWLQAYALCILGNRASLQSGDCDEQAHRLLGALPAGERFPGSHLSDVIYSTDQAAEADFNRALGLMDIEVEE